MTYGLFIGILPERTLIFRCRLFFPFFIPPGEQIMRKNLIVTIAMLIVALLVAGVAQAQTALAVAINAPTQEVYGHRPLTVEVVITNTDTVMQTADMRVWVGGTAWGKENYPVSSSANSSIYWLECNRSGCTYSWRATMAPGESATFTLPTFTGDTLGTFSPFVTVSRLGVTLASQGITLVEGTGAATAVLHMDPSQMVRGTYGQFRMEVYTPRLSRVTSVQLTSSCGLQYLPTNGNSYTRTYHQWYSIVFVPETAKPGWCTIKGSVQLSSGEQVPVSYRFKIKAKTRGK